MPFVKLDTNILNSTLWFERLQREIFLTALLMAEPVERNEPEPQICVESLDLTGWEVPPGKYGFVPAAGVGIIRRAMIDDMKLGLKALHQLGEPEEGSRTAEYDGRRLVRVDGGFIVLNYFKYRDRDYTSAARSKRYRERKRHAVASTNHTVTIRDITHAEADMQKQSVHPTDVVKDSENLPPSKTKFIPPSLPDAVAYGAEIGMGAAEVESWFDHFTSNGWRVGGKAPMRDWKAALRNGKRHSNKSQSHRPMRSLVEPS